MINEQDINQLLTNEVTKAVKQKLVNVDIAQLVSDASRQEVTSKINEISFPENSIPFVALKHNEIRISGSSVDGGVHKRFKSAGIEDYATDCKLTVMDDNVVIENNLVALNANIKENLQVDGNLIVRGTVPANSKFFNDIVEGVIERLGSTFEAIYKQSIIDGVLHTVKTKGLDVTEFKVNGEVLIKDYQIANKVTESNLQKVGQLKELQVKNEALVADTLYVTRGRVGVNTDEPGSALSVWDEECELVVKKHSKHKGYIGSSRDTTVVLGANNKDNVVLNQDGTTQIEKLKIGDSTFTSQPTKPNFASRKGHVVFNSHPDLGRPVGWICLGDDRWSEFGKCE
jgi:hypothetical protein